MKPVAAALAFALAAGAALPAAALSCPRPDPVRLYTQARDAEARYRIVHGTLTAQQAIPGRKRTGADRLNPGPIQVKARLRGMQLGADGFSTPVDTPVTVTLDCFASWCGSWPGSEPLLMSVEEGMGGQLIVTADPCSSQIYPRPTEAELRRVLTCHRGGDCRAAMR